MKSLFVITMTATLALSVPALHAQTTEVPLIGNDGTAIGRISLQGGTGPTVVRVTIEPGKVSAGWHGVHFHGVGDCSDREKFLASKSHVNHGGRKHGLLNPEGPDDGDLPNVFAAADGSVNAEVSSPTPLAALRDADGSAFVMHANEDDHMAQPIGGAGARIACAVIR